MNRSERAPAAAPATRVEKEHIFVGVPCEGDIINVGVQQFLAWLDRVSMLAEVPYRFTWVIEIAKKGVDYARNVIVKDFFQTNASRLVMVDADMVPSPEFLNLLEIDADIAAPRMFSLKKNDAGQPRLDICAYKFNVDGKHTFHSIAPRDEIGPAECDAVGTGMIVIRRAVLEDRRMWLNPIYVWRGETYNLEDERDDPRWAPPIFRFQYKPNGDILRGEDLDFCFRAKEFGYRIVCAFHIGCGHAKLTNLDDVATIAGNAIGVFQESLARGAAPAVADDAEAFLQAVGR